MLPKKPDPIPLTKEAYERAQSEYKRYKKLEEEVLVRLSDARAMGDLSENGAYKYAKFELGNVRRQLRTFGHLIRWGVIQEKSSTDTIDFGCSVTVQNEQDKQFTYMIVSKHESNPMEKKLSTDSPLGAALIGKSVGDTAKVDAPAGVIRYTIVSID